jgi:hypothetical protein
MYWYEILTGSMSKDRIRSKGILGQVPENIFRMFRAEMISCIRELFKQNFHCFNSSTNIIIMIKSRKLKWEEHAALVRENRDTYEVLV